MAQEVRLMGATYSDVPSILLPDSNGNYHSFVDATTASSWTKVAETTFTVSTSSTSPALISSFATGDSSLWTSDKIVYVRVRDTAGPREGYYYGNETYFYIPDVINGESSSNSSDRAGCVIKYSSSKYVFSITVQYGIYPLYVYPNGNIAFYSRYSSSYTLTIDGTYKAEVYLLTPPSAIFE